LEGGVSDAQRQWAVDEASKNLHKKESAYVFAKHCHDDQLDSVLTTLVERGLWKSVDKVLKRGVTDAKRQWAVEEAIKKANDMEFQSYILPHCSDDQLDSVLTILVKRGVWESVGKVLKRGVSDEQLQ
jgi:hypothetical protein